MSANSHVTLPVETAMKAVEALKATDTKQASAGQIAATNPARAQPRFSRYALLAASAALGVITGAIGSTLIARPGPTAESLATLDLTLVQDVTANLRSEIAALRSSVESSNRDAHAQFAKFTERLERIDRAPPTREATGSIRPQQTAATPRQPHVDGWVVRQVSRGVASIQGHGGGVIEVEAGDIVPGVGRIESIRRQEGRWVVLTSRGIIPSPTAR